MSWGVLLPLLRAQLTEVVRCRAVVGEVDEEKDAEIDWALVQALPLNPIQH